MAKPKQHHFVPRSYLERFRDVSFADRPVIWMADLDELQIRRTQPSSVAKRGHYYTVVDKEGKRSTEIEETFAKIEGEAAPVLEKLSGWEFELDHKERTDLFVFMSIQFLRVPARRNLWEGFRRRTMEVAASQIMSRPGILENAAKERGENVEDTDFDEIRRYWRENRDDFEIKVNPQVSLQLLGGTELIARLYGDMAMCVVWTMDRAFITSDNPVIWHNPMLPRNPMYGPGLGQKDIQVTMPISPSHTVLLRHDPMPADIQADAKMVFDLNSRIQSHTNRFTFSSSWYSACLSIQGRTDTLARRSIPPWLRC